MAKPGRPKSDDPKDERITVRLNDATMKRLQAYADALGCSKAQVMTEALEQLLKKSE